MQMIMWDQTVCFGSCQFDAALAYDHFSLHVKWPGTPQINSIGQNEAKITPERDVPTDNWVTIEIKTQCKTISGDWLATLVPN